LLFFFLAVHVLICRCPCCRLCVLLTQHPDELPFKAGEKLAAESAGAKKQWWMFVNAQGQSGYGPANYVKLVSPSPSPSQGGRAMASTAQQPPQPVLSLG